MPNTRLVWNFELGTQHITDSSSQINAQLAFPEDARCEYRLFYPHDAIITLPLPTEFEHFSKWDYKERRDTYYLIPAQHLNIKSRKNKLVYKPLLKEQDNILWFAPKQRLDKSDFMSSLSCIPEDLEARLHWLKQEATTVVVEKNAFITELYQGKLLFEMAKLHFDKRIFYTVGLEATPSVSLSELIPLLDHRKAAAQHYIAFLKTHMGIPL